MDKDCGLSNRHVYARVHQFDGAAAEHSSENGPLFAPNTKSRAGIHRLGPPIFMKRPSHAPEGFAGTSHFFPFSRLRLAGAFRFSSFY